jgi:uracil-DNA glycosylase
VPDGVAVPPSLQNMYKEVVDELWGSIPKSWNLSHRAEQWVLLLNAILTVKAHSPASHHGLWWEQFTDAVIAAISAQKEHCVFLLRWNFAKSKKSLIDSNKHLVLEAPHPSPFSAHSGFFWCGHFAKTNAYLMLHNKSTIQRLIAEDTID